MRLLERLRLMYWYGRELLNLEMNVSLITRKGTNSRGVNASRRMQTVVFTASGSEIHSIWNKG